MLVGLSFFAMMGVLFFLSFYLQSVLGYSPLKAGLFLTPFALAQLIFSPLSARLVQRFGARAVSTFGMVVIGVTFLMYQAVNQTSPAWLLLLIFFLQGMGMANVMPPATTTIMTSLPREKAGVGSSVSNTVRQVGGALGVAVLGTLLTTAYRSRMEGPLKTVIPNSSTLHNIDGSIQATKGAGEHFPAAGPLLPAGRRRVHPRDAHDRDDLGDRGLPRRARVADLAAAQAGRGGRRSAARDAERRRGRGRGRAGWPEAPTARRNGGG